MEDNKNLDADSRVQSEEDLHDHRYQPQSLPRHNSMHHSPSRRPSITIAPPSNQMTDAEKDFSHQFEETLNSAVRRRHSSNSDDFIVGTMVMEDSSDDEHLSPRRYEMDRAESGPPALGSRNRGESNANRRPLNGVTQFMENHHTRSRSPSPPNSIDAFAPARRKDRSGTISSQRPPSDLISLRHSASRRGASFEDLRATNSGDEEPEKVEEDVCFPMPEDHQTRWKIDFDEMDDFAQEQNRARDRSCQRRRKMSTASANATTTYSRQAPPFTFRPSQPSDECAIDDEEADDDSTKYDEKARESDDLIKRVGRRQTQPDRFSFFSSELEGTVHAPDFPSLCGEGETFRDLFRGEDNVWWLDVANPTEAEMKMLWRAFSLHPLTYEDIRVQETREKVELFRSYYFVCFRSFVMDRESEDFLEPTNVYLVVFRGGVLSYHFSPYPHASNVRKRIRQLRDYVALSSDWICYAMIDDITDSFGPVIHDIEKQTDAIEDAVFVARSDDFSSMLKRIGECRKKVMTLMRLLGGKADVIKGFAKRCNEQYSVTPRSDIGLYLGDIQG